jgi:hypothetical protein
MREPMIIYSKNTLHLIDIPIHTSLKIYGSVGTVKHYNHNDNNLSCIQCKQTCFIVNNQHTELQEPI